MLIIDRLGEILGTTDGLAEILITSKGNEEGLKETLGSPKGIQSDSVIMWIDPIVLKKNLDTVYYLCTGQCAVMLL